MAQHASAQTPGLNLDAPFGLSAFLSLDATAPGRAALEQNLITVQNIYATFNDSPGAADSPFGRVYAASHGGFLDTGARRRTAIQDAINVAAIDAFYAAPSQQPSSKDVQKSWSTVLGYPLWSAFGQQNLYDANGDRTGKSALYEAGSKCWDHTPHRCKPIETLKGVFVTAEASAGHVASQAKAYFGNGGPAQDQAQSPYNVAYGYDPYGAVSQKGDPRPYQTFLPGSGQAMSPIQENPWLSLVPFPDASTGAKSATSTTEHDNQQNQWEGNANSPAFPSGHTTYGYTAGLLYAMMLPEKSQDVLAATADFGLSRNILGVHYPLDVIGGRIIALQTLTALLNDPIVLTYANQTRTQSGETTELHGVKDTTFGQAFAQATLALRDIVKPAPRFQCDGSLSSCLGAGAFSRTADDAAKRAFYLWSLTYGLPAVGAVENTAVVPQGAEALLATRYPYLTDTQRRDVLASTELPSGAALDDGSGWARLNLFDATNGYGALARTTTVTMNKEVGGFSALDVWSNAISGPGGLIKAGTGSLVLSGTNSYTGGTQIAGGTLGLAQGGTLVGNVSVAGGATFLTTGGYTVAPGATLANEGLVAAVGSPLRVSGTLSNGGLILGDIAFEHGSTFAVSVDAAGHSGSIVGQGRATLGGAGVAVLAQAGDYARRTRYAILTSAEGFDGRFGAVSTNLAFLTPSLSYDANTVTLTLRRNDMPFLSAATTSNQKAIAGAIDGALAVADNASRGSDGDPASQTMAPVNALHEALLGTTAPQATAAFSALSGEGHAAAATVGLTDAQLINGLVFDRLATQERSRADALAAIAVALPAQARPPVGLQGYAALPMSTPGNVAAGAGLWGTGFGDVGRNHGRDVATLGRSTGGFTIGADRRLDGSPLDGWQAGLLGGYANSQISLETPRTVGSFETFFGGLYAGRDFGALSLRLGAIAGATETNLRRTIAFDNFSDAAKASYGGTLAQGFGELGYRVDLQQGSLTPLIQGAVIHLAQNAFEEAAGDAGLTGAARGYDLQTATLGLRFESAPLFTTPLFARGLIGWRHAFGDVTPTAVLAFSTGSTPFPAVGAPLDRDAALVQAGLAYLVVADLTLDLRYAGQVGASAIDNAVKGSVEYRF